jgi:hypothetical protein
MPKSRWVIMSVRRILILTAAVLATVSVAWKVRSVWAVYSYYKTDGFSSIDTGYWNYMGSLTANGILTAGGNGGSLIAKNYPPSGLSEYEIRSKVVLKQNGGAYIHLYRATPDARPRPLHQGTFYSVELINPTFNVTTGGVQRDAVYLRAL